MRSKEITLTIKPFDKKIARTNYHVEFTFDDGCKIDIRERILRVVKQSIEDDLQKTDMLS